MESGTTCYEGQRSLVSLVVKEDTKEGSTSSDLVAVFSIEDDTKKGPNDQRFPALIKTVEN